MTTDRGIDDPARLSIGIQVIDAGDRPMGRPENMLRVNVR